jgi:hypothetical protein
LFHRAAAVALCVSVALGAAAAPCAASDAATSKRSSLTTLSPASRQVLVAPAGLASPRVPAKRSEGAQAQTTPGATGPFFKTTRGKVTLALMGAGVGFTIWSINHDRKPVKSPVR